MISRPGHLRLILLGGFEAWHHDELLRGFESQKVRALLAYLALHRGRALSRDRLAALFWGDRDAETARRNLRQAIYNLKATLPGENEAEPHVLVDPQELRFNRRSDFTLDVEAFEDALGRGGDDVASFRDLAAAAQTYRGDLLSGLLVRDCPDFEEWLLTEQERLRERALDALRRLVAAHLARGEFRSGIAHARRWVDMDPLSEEAHRQLMRLFDLAGQRGRALAHYEELRDLLRHELGIEPLEETQRLRESIVADSLASDRTREAPPPAAPIVPLAGRRDAHGRLSEEWSAVAGGEFRLTLVEGEEGVGKTRLVRSFLDTATANRRCVVLRATCSPDTPAAAGQPLAEALRTVLEDDELAPRLAALGPSERLELAALVPELARGASGALDLEPGPSRLADGLAALLQHLTRHGGSGELDEPVVLVLDDLHHADPLTAAVVEELPRRLAGSRVWILAALDPATAGNGALAALAARDGDGVVSRVGLERLDGEAIEEIAAALIAPDAVDTFADWLIAATDGLPLAVVTHINTLWDESRLVPAGGGRWRPEGELGPTDAVTVDTLLLRRVLRLPTSTRRLATMAAVIGDRFDTALLERAENEHPVVVEAGLEILVERWLVRQHRRRWHPAGLEKTHELWVHGARRGEFVFEHARLREALYSQLNPLRRQALHRQVTGALREGAEAAPPSLAAALAHHALAAGLWEEAFDALRQVAERSRMLGDRDGERSALERLAQVAERLQREADDGARRRWSDEVATLRARLSEPST